MFGLNSILKAGSNGEIAREINRNQQLNKPLLQKA
jgi:hypothetical protein